MLINFRTATLAAGVIVTGFMAVSAQAQSARDYISIVGSSTVYPFATVVAENFGRSTSFKTPKIESTGSGGGLKLFCTGVGVEHPDITNSSRRIKQSEIDTCAGNGVNDIIEVKIGYDGIVMANSKKAAPMKLTRKDIFLALAKHVPNPNKDCGPDATPGTPEFDALHAVLRQPRYWMVTPIRLGDGLPQAFTSDLPAAGQTPTAHVRVGDGPRKAVTDAAALEQALQEALRGQ